MPHATDENNDDSQASNMASCLNDFDTHLDLKRDEPRNLVRLIALMQAGWTLSRGNGPRHHPYCLWCRGDFSHRTEILIHDKCNNAWAASCFMDFVHYECDETHHQRLSCPICRATFHTRPWRRHPELAGYPEPMHNPPQHDFEVSKNVNISAHIRIVMYNPASVIKAVQYSKTLMIMTRDEMAKLAMFGRNKSIFNVIDDVKTEWGRVFLQWAVISWGNNEYRASPLFAHQETALLELLAAKGLGSPMVKNESAQILEEWVASTGRVPAGGVCYRILKDNSAQILEEWAASRGGLATAVAAFKPDSQDDDIKEMTTGGKEEALKTLEAEQEKEKSQVQDIERISAGVHGLFRAFGMVLDDDGDEEPTEEVYHEGEDYDEEEEEEDEEDLEPDPGAVNAGTLTLAQPHFNVVVNPEESDDEPFL
ncbi:hypothetical protein LTR10_017891 [Elasticomyces elasticus]|uniref:RING-type domain-containing protein n=1 Tax=Exophiala sideris TaxID=1016849 RepID=A0ABR0IWZ5_9EURO|nr:hypothetical protein LTR10_017891 [Elasticomyces elasticus]KAK5021818.1 hypothetical protein LTS07_010713 [Exophiala sideris]KAK5025824.1 hypothetical protein LTR13_010287 [Exophiala sideris]KAK5050188.1 hypothetical protein LTR69_010675 [Exophiala sideris]KAK5177055.1 hypothetical protein LTR44_010492 [Eurotiomycetes sp. CCFEE 6388]